MKLNGVIENQNSDARLILRDYRDGRDGVVSISPEMIYATETLLTAVFEEIVSDPNLNRNEMTKETAAEILWHFEDDAECVRAQFAESTEAARGLYALFMLLPEETRRMAQFLVIRAMSIH